MIPTTGKEFVARLRDAPDDIRRAVIRLAVPALVRQHMWQRGRRARRRETTNR